MAATGFLAAQSQMVVSTDLTPEQLVQDVLAGSCVTITNVTYNGQPANTVSIGGHGSFTQTGDLGLASGVILSSGFATTVAGPETNLSSDDLGNNGDDPDLEAIMGFSVTNYSILEFDFVPTGDSVSFRYVFGSEEYPTYVCSFNDAFGFFLSGPGISGPYTNGAINIAVLPDGVTPVSISNVNSGVGNDPDDPSCPAVNPQYYVNNTDGETVCVGGFTTVLTAKAEVQCGQTYHIKLAIGDAGGEFGDTDTAFDSFVFLEAGSFSSEPFIPTLEPSAGVVGNTIIESCLEYSMGFVRIACDASTAQTVYLSYAGTAEMGVDVVPALPDSLFFDSGVEVVYVSFTVPQDPDGLETIDIITETVDCEGLPTSATFTFSIGEAEPLVVQAISELVPCGGAVTLDPIVSGGFGQYDYVWSDGATGPTNTFTAVEPTTVELVVNDICSLSSSVSHTVDLTPAPQFNMLVFGSDELREGCDVGSINFLRPTGTQGDYTISVVPSGSATAADDFSTASTIVIADGILSTQQSVTALADALVEDEESIILTGSATNACQQTVTEVVEFSIINVDVLSADVPSFTVPCSGDSLELIPVIDGGVAPYQFEWTNGDSTSSIWVDLQNDGSYPVTIIDACNNTTVATGSVVVDCVIIIPNVFTPNQDGQNDRWEISGLGLKPNTLKIYNRWGGVVFDKQNYNNTFNGSGVPDGTYFYELLVEGKDEPYTGHLTILR